MKSPDVELKVITSKEGFVLIEAGLLRDWLPFLDKKATKVLYVYALLQLYTNRVSDNKLYGKSWLSIRRLGDLCNMSAPSVYNCLDVLEEFSFITREKREGRSTLYTVLVLPEFQEEKVVGKVEDGELLDGIRSVMEKKVASKKGSTPSMARVNKLKQEDKENAFSLGTGTYTKEARNKSLKWLREFDAKLKLSAPDLVKYFTNYYMVQYEGMRPKVDRTIKNNKPGKNARLMAQAVEEFGSSRVKRMIQFAIDNWGKLDYVNGYPSISSIYGFRESLIPESEAGQLKNKRGQYSGVALKHGEWE